MGDRTDDLRRGPPLDVAPGLGGHRQWYYGTVYGTIYGYLCHIWSDDPDHSKDCRKSPGTVLLDHSDAGD